MASIRERSGTWQARVRREGYPAEVRSFTTRGEAQRWAREIEVAMDGGGYRSRCAADKMLLGDALLRYAKEVSPTKRGHLDEVIRIKALRRTKMAGYSMAKLSPAIVAGFRDDRLKVVKAGAVNVGFRAEERANIHQVFVGHAFFEAKPVTAVSNNDFGRRVVCDDPPFRHAASNRPDENA